MHQQRSVGLCVFLTIITCGIYGFYWIAVLNDDANEVTGHGTTSGGMVVLFTIITCGIYGVYWSYKMGEKLDQARFERNIPTGSQSILYLVLSLVGFGIIGWALMQSELNKYYFGGDDL